MAKKVMVKCATVGCKRLVFPKQKYCWKCRLKRRKKP